MDEDELIGQLPGIPYPEVIEPGPTSISQGRKWHADYTAQYPTVEDTHALYDSLLQTLYNDEWSTRVGTLPAGVDISPVLMDAFNVGLPLSQVYVMVGGDGDIGRYRGANMNILGEGNRAYFRPDKEWDPSMDRMPVDTAYVPDPTLLDFTGEPFDIEPLLAEVSHLWQYSGKDVEGVPQVAVEDLPVFRDSLDLANKLQRRAYGEGTYNIFNTVENQAHYTFEPLLIEQYLDYLNSMKNEKGDDYITAPAGDTYYIGE